MQRFPFNQLETSDLIVDAIYEGGRAGNAGDDPLHRLLVVSNQGGFRYLGSKDAPKLIVLTSSFNDPDWPDQLDRETGVLTYFGDNKHPGRALHETPRNGNRLLQQLFDALHSHPPRRQEIPPVLVFGSAGEFRDVAFLGLAVPGARELEPMDDLVATWKISAGQRFQNYRAAFTILDVPCVTRKWIEEIKSGNPLSSSCPKPWRDWIESGIYRPLQAQRSIEHRTRADQIPENDAGRGIIETIQTHFSQRPVEFEACAARIAQMMDRNFFSFNLTRPSRDGGRDAIGLYRIGHGDSAICVDFALEAKCYGLNNSVGVREVSRLISRLRHRQFGVLVSTSYLHSQAYREIKEDEHPIVIISAKDIVAILAHAGINSLEHVQHWLTTEFPGGHQKA